MTLDEAREKYRPARIRAILIAESPPDDPDVLAKIRNLNIPTDTPIIHISKSVWDAHGEYLQMLGYHIANESMVPFPGSGQQEKYRERMSSVLTRYGFSHGVESA